ncbi:NAD(P)H-quinone oxidoreductase [Alteriqipengyuania flavescens]|uniref:NAD(P)H-quinone oxidoreductase n=1 Tax=Alteriqipengyuania flavescens TaxID=3053610 RepID=UPI0025B5DF91|nr:NAD(P)H-quinone oxidoreductase [Alteriqipengyuania flavescens]WJY19561.1 NAD(P)H-quinone oxidoreductase [Alteriqipengyuania flavescens]WJY25501.1 NAD(P)H-quinone oxidoreductase [Alteriqipengyuania flavescens]
MSDTMTDTMTAIGYDAPGEPQVLRPEELDMPRPGPGQVLVRVAHAGVNRPDVVQRKGFYPPPPGAPKTPGLEIAGEIAELGDGVAQWSAGDRVCALVPGGGYAEYCLAHAGHCLPVPAGLPLHEAAALPETLFTVWHNVFQRGMAKDGETILVHGGTSGIGTTAIQLANAFDIEIIVTCGSDEKCAAARRIGAAHAINYKTTDFAAEVERITEGAGVHMVLDMVSGDYVARNIKCLKPGGRHVTIAVQGGLQAEINMAQVMQKRLVLTGSTLRPRDDTFKVLLANDIRENAWPLVEDGSLRPIMAKRFPLAEAAAAHAYMESGDLVGKIVLDA